MKTSLSRGPTYQVLGSPPTLMDGPSRTKQKIHYMFRVSSNRHNTTLLQSFNTQAAILSTIHTTSPPNLHTKLTTTAFLVPMNAIINNSLIFVDHMIPRHNNFNGYAHRLQPHASTSNTHSILWRPSSHQFTQQ